MEKAEKQCKESWWRAGQELDVDEWMQQEVVSMGQGLGGRLWFTVFQDGWQNSPQVVEVIADSKDPSQDFSNDHSSIFSF